MEVAFRPFRREDVERLVELANNPRVAATLRDQFPHPYTRKDAEDWIELNLSSDVQHNFVITVDGELAGGVGLVPRDDVYRLSAEVGYWLGEPYWGRGIATRCLVSFCTWVFDTFDFHRLYAAVFSSNPASMRVLEKSGFVLEGRLRQAVLKNRELLDELIYAQLRPGE